MSIQQGEVLYFKGDESNQLPIISPIGGSFQLMSQYRISKKIAKVAVEENCSSPNGSNLSYRCHLSDMAVKLVLSRKSY